MSFLQDFISWLDQTATAIVVRESTWLFPTIETVHVFALAIVFGSIAMLDLRLLSWFSRERPVSELAAEVLPWTWVGFGVAVLSGGLLFISAAPHYAVNGPFLTKLVLLLLAGINMLAFHLTAYRSVSSWDCAARTPLAARIAAGSSLFLWIAVIACGRWIGFV